MKILIINIIIFFLAIIFGVFVVMSMPVSGEDELMICDNCKKSVLMEYDGNIFTNITLIYEW